MGVQMGMTPSAKQSLVDMAQVHSRTVSRVRAVDQHNGARVGARARSDDAGGEAGVVVEVQVEGQPADEDPVWGPCCQVLRPQEGAGGEDHSVLRDSWQIYFLQTRCVRLCQAHFRTCLFFFSFK